MSIPEGRWYQEATINGVVMPTRRNNDTSEVRWNTFIKPLLPFDGDGRLCVDLGCNAGFYLRQMADLGFNGIGVDKDPIYAAHARYWEAGEPKGVTIIEGNLLDYDIPAASIVILANVHYWLSLKERAILEDQLWDKAMYCLVIGRHKTAPEHTSLCDMENMQKTFLKRTFEAFETVDTVRGKKHYSILFKNPNLCEKDTEEILSISKCYTSKQFMPSFLQFVELVLSGDEFDMKDTAYWKYLVARSMKKREQDIHRHAALILDAKERGIVDPLVFDGDVIKDGNHRMLVAHALGIKHLICRIWRDPNGC